MAWFISPEDEVTKREINTRRKTMYIYIYVFKLVEYKGGGRTLYAYGTRRMD
jgi:hypothetical protein